MVTLYKYNRGIALVETVIYSVLLVVVLVILVQSSISLLRTHRMVKLRQSLESSGVISMERILREVRSASSVDIANSTLNSSPGVLTLLGKDENDILYEIVFALAGGAISISKDGAPPGALSVPGIRVDSLIFRSLESGESSSVKVEVSLSGSTTDETKNLDLFGSAILRNSY